MLVMYIFLVASFWRLSLGFSVALNAETVSTNMALTVGTNALTMFGEEIEIKSRNLLIT
jgi:hypothetical protein